jgi:hypothetical protein
MIKQSDTILHNGRPIPLNTCDKALPASTLVPSKREALLAFDFLYEKYSDDLASLQALSTLERFLGTR